MIQLIYIFLLLVIFTQETLIAWTGISQINYLDEFILVLMFIYSFILVFKRSKIRKETLWILLLTSIFCVVGIISSKLYSNQSSVDLVVAMFLSIKFLILVATGINIPFKDSTIKKFIKSILVIEKIVIIVLLFSLMFPNLFRTIFPATYYTYRFGFLAATSIFDHPGKFGWFMLFCSTIHYSYYKSSGDRKGFYKFCLSAALALLSLRTKVILTLIVFLLFNNIRSRTISIKTMKKIVVSLVVVSAISFVFFDIIKETYVLYFTETKGISARQSLTDNGFRIANDHFPLGVGFGKYGTWMATKNYSEYYYYYGMSNVFGLSPTFSSYATDTFWPGIIGETGYLGLLLYSSILVYIGLKLYKKDENDIIVSIALLALIQSLVESFGEPSFNSAPQYFIVGIVISFAFAQRDLRPNTKGLDFHEIEDI